MRFSPPPFFSLFSLVIPIFFLFPPNLFSLNCVLCKGAIQGGYLKHPSGNFHQNCLQNSPKCPVCGGPLLPGESARKNRGVMCHSHCIGKLSACSHCKEGILPGKYFQLENENFHGDCAQKAEKCGSCKGPIGRNWQKVKDKKYHTHCASQLIFCDECHHPIDGKYVIDIRKRKICSRHNLKATCSACFSPGEGLEKLSDGRLMCPTCKRSRGSDSQNQTRYEIVKTRLEQGFGLKILGKVPLHIVDRNQLNKVMGKETLGLKGVYKSETITRTSWLGLKKEKLENSAIYILSQLPAEESEAVMAHELTHAWQKENCPPNQDLMLKEGIAELISYLYGKRYGLKLSTALSERNIYPDYKQGLENGLKFYQKLGLTRVLEKAKLFLSFSEFN